MPKSLDKLATQEYLVRTRVALENVLNNPVITAALALFGFGAGRIGEGTVLLETAENLTQAQKVAYAGQHASTQALNQARATADGRYTLHHRLALLTFQDDDQTQETLDIHRRKQNSFSKWLCQVGQFYHRVLVNPEIIEALGRYNITQEDLQAGLALVNQVIQLDQEQEDAKGQAQQATRDRDAALENLSQWMSEFREVAKIALAGTPELYESLQLGTVR